MGIANDNDRDEKRRGSEVILTIIFAAVIFVIVMGSRFGDDTADFIAAKERSFSTELINDHWPDQP